MNHVLDRAIALFMIFSITASLLIVNNTGSAFACSCAEAGTPAESLNGASAVFSGKLIGIGGTYSGFGKVVKFDVEKSWKGTSEETITVSTGMGYGDCGYFFEVGKEYLVYAYGSEELSTSICSRTAPLQDTKEDLEELGMPLKIYSLTVDDKIFKIPYRISNGEVREILAAPEIASLIVNMESDPKDDGIIELTIPSEIITPIFEKEETEPNLIALLDGEEIEVEKVNTSPCFRSILVEFPAGSEKIEIFGPASLGPGPAPPAARKISLLYISTDKNNYDAGEIVKVSGCTSLGLADDELTLEVLNPEGKVWFETNLYPNRDGAFSTSVHTGGADVINGTYVAKATYSGESTMSAFVVPEFPVNLMTVTAIGLIGTLLILRFRRQQSQHRMQSGVI